MTESGVSSPLSARASATPRLVGLPMGSFASMIVETIAETKASVQLQVRLEDNRNYVFTLEDKVPVVQANIRQFLAGVDFIKKNGIKNIPVPVTTLPPAEIQAQAYPQLASPHTPSLSGLAPIGPSASPTPATASDSGSLPLLSAAGQTGPSPRLSFSASGKQDPRKHKDGQKKSKKNKAKSKVFGIPLETLIANENEEATVPDSLPGIVRACIQYLARFGLEVPGLFAISNNTPLPPEFNENDYDFMKNKTPKVEDKDPQSVIEASCVLIHFLRELPEPLISKEIWAEMLPSLAKVGRSRFDDEAFVKNIKECLKSVPQCNRDLLSALCTLLHIVHLNRSATHMTAHNLAVIFAPLILRIHVTPGSNVKDHSKTILLFAQLILRCNELFDLIQEPATDAIYGTTGSGATYVDLCKLILEPKLHLVIALGKVMEVTQMEQLAKDLVFTFYKNKQYIHLIKTVVRNEVQETVDSGTLFRSNTMATHLLTQFSRIVGLKYLRQLLHPLIKELTTVNKELFDMVSEKLTPQKLEENRKFIVEQATKFLNTITNSIEDCPSALRGVLGILQQEVLQKFPDSRYISVGGFFFLRFACPAIVSPEGFGVISMVPPEVRKGLVFISKTIQSIANGTVSKEESMTFLTDFIQNNIPVVRDFLDKLASAKLKSKQQVKVDPPRVKHGAMARIHMLLNTRLMEIDEALSLLEDGNANRRELMVTLSKLGPPPSKEILELRDRFPILAGRIVGHVKSIQTITIRNDGKQVWSADLAGVIRGWDVDTGEAVNEIQSNLHNIFAIACINTQMWIAAGECLAVYDITTKRLIKTVTAEPTFSFVVVGDKVWCAGMKAIQVFDPRTLDIVHSISTQGKMFFTLAHIGNTVWGGTNESSIVIWNSTNYKQIKDIKEGHQGKINSVVRVAESSTIWSSADDSKICVWDSTTYELKQVFSSHRGKIFNLCDFGNQVWSLSWDNSIQIWHSRSFAHVGELSTGHNDAINSVVPAFNAKLNEWVAWTGSLDRSICVWRVPGCTLPPPGSEEEAPVVPTKGKKSSKKDDKKSSSKSDLSKSSKSKR